MDRTELMALGTILKAILALIGMITTTVLVIVGLTKKDNKRLKRAAMIFLGTWLLLVILGAIELLFLANL